MTDIKYKDPNITTIQEYIHKHILVHVRGALDDNKKNVKYYYGLLDRGGNLAKRLFAGKHRDDKVKPLPDPGPEDRPFVLPVNGLLPQQWDSIIANRGMTRREVYPLYYRAFMEIYEPPAGKYIVLDGAPCQPLTKEEFEQMGDTAFQRVYGAETAAAAGTQMSNYDALNTPMAVPPVTTRYECPPERYKHNIQEADLSAFFHITKHLPYRGNPPGLPADPVIVVDTNDGDYIWIALLQTPDRIDRESGKFNSRVWVKLKGQEASKAASKKRKTAAADKKQKALEKGDEDAAAAADAVLNDPIDGRDVYININMLYKMMSEDPDLQYAQFPQGTAVLLYILGGTDFFDDLDDETALFHGMDWENFVWDTWCTHKKRFANLIMVFYTGPAEEGQPEVCRRPYVDEEALITFFQECYAVKYGKTVRKLYDAGKVTIPQLLEYTQSFASNCKAKDGEEPEKYRKRLNQARKKAMPETAVMQRYVRLALLNFRLENNGPHLLVVHYVVPCSRALRTDPVVPHSYWLNGYRPGGEEYCNPLEEYEGFPYYGYMVDPAAPTTRYKLSPIVSGPKPVPDFVVPNLGLHRQEAGEDAAAEQAASEQAAQAAAEARERAKEEMRLERQRKLAAKEKRLSAAQTNDKELPAPRPAQKRKAPVAAANVPIKSRQAPLPQAYQVPAAVPRKRQAPPPPAAQATLSAFKRQ